MTVPENQTTATLVIGVGNPMRRDDGAGPAVLRELTNWLPKDVVGIQHSGEGAGLMDAWEGADRVILVDATCSGTLPGTVRRFDASGAELPRKLFRYSSHLFGVAEAVELARSLGRLPRKLIVYGIEGEAFDYGEELSAEVAGAVERVAEVIIRELNQATTGDTVAK